MSRACRCVSAAPSSEEGVPPAEAASEQLRGLSVRALKLRAHAVGVSVVELEAAEDEDDYAAAVAELILARERVAAGAADHDVLRAELAQLTVKGLKQRASAAGATSKQLEEAEEAEDFKLALVELVVSLTGHGRSRDDLRAELAAMKVGQLKKRAIASNVTEAELEAAEEADDYSEAIIELILEKECADGSQEKLRQQLIGMQVSALKRRALGLGVLAEDLDDADDADDTRSAVVALILEAGCTSAASAHTQRDPHAELRNKLEALKIKALRAKAADEGVPAEALADADDAEDVKQEVIRLILARWGNHSTKDSTKRRAELEPLKLKALKVRATEAGVAADVIADVDDADDPRAAVIELLLSCEPASLPTKKGSSPLQQELSALRFKELRARAKDEGISADLLEDAMDQDDPSGAVVQLLLDARSAADTKRQQLTGLRLRELRARAKEAGHSAVSLEAAADSDDPKTAVIELLLGPAPISRRVQTPLEPELQPEPQPQPEPEPQPALARSVSSVPAGPEHPVYRALEAHQLEAHFEKLLELGVKRVEDLEHVTQAELDELGMKRFDRQKFMSAFITEVPHHGLAATGVGKSTATAAAAAVDGFCFEGGKHAMFSYQWDNQAQVTNVREHFAARGIPTWMDVDGGMQIDVFDSMAQGVANAAVVVAFMTQRYQDSDNCALELKYAKQRKIPIVPVKLQDNWRAEEWLGIITAGALWTPLHDESTMQQNLDGLVEQIKLAVPTVTTSEAKPASRFVASAESDEVMALRSELDRLQMHLSKAALQRASPTKGDQDAAAATTMAPLPAEVPALSVNLRPTPDMEKLKVMLISHGADDDTSSSKMAVTSERSKVGALGMGGIGKTVTATWLARNAEIRSHFKTICWCTLGQDPDLEHMKALMYMQLVGEELPADTSPEKAKEKITVAMRNRLVLLVLDDCWEPAHEAALNFIDTSTLSKVLITTRIRGLGGASQLELGVPSEEESVQLLLSSAGLAHLSSAPTEAAEIVQLVGRLPLAVDLCGRMLKDFGVSGSDWVGIPQLLQEELRSGDRDETTVEYRVLAASLSSIPLRDRESAKKVFQVFALVAEDTHIPMGAFRILLSAVTGEMELVPEMTLRRWIQVLVNRSIVLGSWEKPSLHDITREYAISLFTPDELRELQQKAVEAFCAARPRSKDDDSLFAWPKTELKTDLERYVKRELVYHVRDSVDLSTPSDALPSCMETWICHYPDDPVVQHTVRTLGLDRLRALHERSARSADTDGQWLAVCAYGGINSEVYRIDGEAALLSNRSHLTQWFQVHNRVSQRPQCVSAYQYEHWELGWRKFAFSAAHLFSHLPAEDLASNGKQLFHLLESTAYGRSQPKLAREVNFLRTAGPLYDRGEDIDAADSLALKVFEVRFQEEVEKGENGNLLGRVADPVVSFHWYRIETMDAVSTLLRLPEWRWDTFGSDCRLLTNALAAQDAKDASSGHREIDGQLSGLYSSVAFLVAMRGHIGAAQARLTSAMSAVMVAHTRVQEEEVAGENTSDGISERLSEGWVMNDLPWTMYCLGRGADAAEIMTATGWAWSKIDALVDSCAAEDSEIRARGSTERSRQATQSAEQWSWTIRLAYVLCTSWREVPAAEIIAELPSPETLESYVTKVGVQPTPVGYRHGFKSLPLMAALVCEKLEQHDDALAYAAVALRYTTEPSASTDMRPTTLSQAHALRGRILASKGAKEEAERSFSAAIDCAHTNGLRLLEMYAIRDLKKCVLDSDERGSEGIQRLKAVLTEMEGPPAELTKLLGGGLDAEAILKS